MAGAAQGDRAACKSAVFLFNPETAPYADFFLNSFKAAAAAFAIAAITAPVRDVSQLEKVIAEQSSEPNSGLIVMPDAFTAAHREQITSFAARYHLPSVYPFRFFVQLGGLMSYGNDAQDNFRRAATYVDRILKGAQPGELPVQAPVKFELVINVKTAKGTWSQRAAFPARACGRGHRIGNVCCNCSGLLL
jgi:putative ABC transport system substrate-binding protein